MSSATASSTFLSTISSRRASADPGFAAISASISSATASTRSAAHAVRSAQRVTTSGSWSAERNWFGSKNPSCVADLKLVS